MNIKIIKHALIMFIFIIFQAEPVKESELIEKNNSLELRNLNDEMFGVAILSFPSTGNKTLVNVNDISKDKLAFYLKIGDELTEISSNSLSEGEVTNSEWFDSTQTYYYVKKITYILNNVDYEIVIKIKEKLTTLKGLFALSGGSKIVLKNFSNRKCKTYIKYNERRKSK